MLDPGVRSENLGGTVLLDPGVRFENLGGTVSLDPGVRFFGGYGRFRPKNDQNLAKMCAYIRGKFRNTPVRQGGTVKGVRYHFGARGYGKGGTVPIFEPGGTVKGVRYLFCPWCRKFVANGRELFSVFSICFICRKFTTNWS